MRLRIQHRTTFSYDRPVSEAYTEMRLRPLDGGGQRCLSFTLRTDPRGEVVHYRDRFGNDVGYFDVLAAHERLQVSAVSEVQTPEVFVPDPDRLSPLDAHDYLMPTDYAPFHERVTAFAAPHAVAGAPRETALGLMAAVRAALRYEKGATDVKTTAEQALERGGGVCQDFAHLFLAACRSQGLPARYVSGYLHTQDAEAASHAWVDVRLPDEGWFSLDPTHGVVQTAQYVRVAVGRDYADVSPTRGVYKGQALETLGVEVSVETA